MGTNKKLLTLLVFLLLAFVTLNLFLILKYKTQLSQQTEIKKQEEAKTAEVTKKAPFPQINTFELPPAKAGAGYYSEVFATLTNANEDLQITVTGLPDGLTLGKCSQEFDFKLIPTPNTLTKCVIEGTPAKDGLYQIKVSATNKNNSGYHTVEQTIDLAVTTP
jgi:hypothetical protein